MLRHFAVAVGTIACAALLSSSAQTQQRRPLRIDAHGEPFPEMATSFDCEKTTLQVEQMICQDRNLAMADGSLGESIWFLKRELSARQRASLMLSQKRWLARRNSCANRRCVEAAYEQRLRELQRISESRGKYLRRNVSRVGQCETTKIDWIGPRLQEVEGELPSGTTVTFKNGVNQVSYHRELAVLSSRVGDPVRVCLTSIPQGCPPGDPRGRVYQVTNLRTGKLWELSDSSHSCGGA